ncbi:hypothetical protein HYH03_012824 [Edaphochlamys debaryana]|uniref:phytol kinase n=1 Tax=Edaphochlamys debaryana TaxID=47281 RepID=A0A835XS61_9CHLO|nr:hypothetical protein HYH03_012824 [Edaphochlamys debaryana]|eukprot:KAG2488662.1 hypothetical protein HYH03_012824 [Edaphochlamys debaryana]
MELSRDVLVLRLRAQQTALDVIQRMYFTSPERIQRIPGRLKALEEAKAAVAKLYSRVFANAAVASPLQSLERWLGACEEAGTWAWLAARMTDLARAVEFCADASLPAVTRVFSHKPALLLLQAAAEAMERLTMPLANIYPATGGPSPDTDPDRARLLARVAAPLWTADFMCAVVTGLRSCAHFAHHTAQPGPDVQRALVASHGGKFAPGASRLCAQLTSSCAFYAVLVVGLLEDLQAPGGSPDARPDDESETAPAPELAAPRSQLLAVLAESQLLPTVAWAVLQGCPAPDPDLILSQDGLIGTMLRECATYTQYCACLLASALSRAHGLLSTCTRDVAPQLASQLSHPNVVALQEALLERLCVHGGVELEGEGQDRGQAVEDLEGQQEVEGAGPSGRAAPARWQGRWWLPALEARLGHVIGGSSMQGWRCEETADWLVQAHADALACLAHGLCSPVNGSPPPPRLARLEPRALEALCRLQRGEGLGGAYSRRPDASLSLLTLLPDVNRLLFETRSAETLAWALALNLEGLEAGLAGGGDREASGLTELYAGTEMALYMLRQVCEARAPALLGAPSREALAAALTRAGLAASLDHALRLAFAAADRAACHPQRLQLNALARYTAYTPVLMSHMLSGQVLPARVRLEASGGVLVTLGKRARMMTRRLRELEAEVEGSRKRAARALARKQEHDLLARIIERMLPSMPGPEMLSGGTRSPQPGSTADAAGPPGPPPEAQVFAGRELCLLAAQAAARAVQWRLRPAVFRKLLTAVTNALLYLRTAGCDVGLTSLTPSGGRLSAPQLLALQPQRLLAAACKLVRARVSTAADPSAGGPGKDAADAAPDPTTLAARAAMLAAMTVAELAAHPQLSNRVRSWLVPPSGGGGSSGGGSGDGRCGGDASGSGSCKGRGGDGGASGRGGGGVSSGGSGDGRGGGGVSRSGAGRGGGARDGSAPGVTSEQGCLEPFLRLGIQPLLQKSDEAMSASLECLLRAAARGDNGGDGHRALGGVSDAAAADRTTGPCDGGAATAAADPGSGFRRLAAVVAKGMRVFVDVKVWVGDLEAPLQDDMGAAEPSPLELPDGEGGSPPAGEGAPPDESAAVLAAALPPPIAVPLAEAAFPGLRVCAYPGCLSYGGRSEAELPLLMCVRCKCVRYCSQECHKADWEEGHKNECRRHCK